MRGGSGEWRRMVKKAPSTDIQQPEKTQTSKSNNQAQRFDGGANRAEIFRRDAATGRGEVSLIGRIKAANGQLGLYLPGCFGLLGH